MKRVRLTIAYDGTNYCGWQVQINGITVEEVLNKALKDLLNVTPRKVQQKLNRQLAGKDEMVV